MENGYLNDEVEERNGEKNDASHSELAGEKTDVRDRNEEECDSDYNDSYYDLMGEEDNLMFEKFVDDGIERDMPGAENAIEDDDDQSESSGYAPSDMLLSCSETDEDEGHTSRTVFAEFDEETNIRDPKL